MIRCYITDRRLLAPPAALLDAIARQMLEGVEWIQIREKDLSARELFELVQNALALRNPHGAKILVNTRIDVALAAGAAGVHLPAGSPSPAAWRRITPPGFFIGVSCHTVEEVRAAEQEGADYAVFGPVFPPRSKTSPLPARGLAALEQATAAVRIPVLALGGITPANMEQCRRAGAAGVAAISLYQESGKSC